jgi:hypothetical protein
MSASAYIDVGYRSYELVIVHGLIEVDGELFRCYVDHDQQQVRVSDTIPPGIERMCLVAQAVSDGWKHCCRDQEWRMVPVLGRV